MTAHTDRKQGMPNNHLNNWKRAVIKVGSSLIAPDGAGCSTRYLLALAEFIIDAHQNGQEIILVSSGSVAAGAERLARDETPDQVYDRSQLSIPQKQAMAAIGQSRLMAHWQKLFDFPCAQLLVTRSDLDSKQRSLNAFNTLNALIAQQCLPVINENDSVVIDELVVGDNDRLAAQVAVLARADLLIICSDVNGMYNKNPAQFPDAELIPEIHEITDEIMTMAGGSDNPIATGGMQTKLQAAQIAQNEGIETLIVNGRNARTYQSLKANLNPGTCFRVNQKAPSA